MTTRPSAPATTAPAARATAGPAVAAALAPRPFRVRGVRVDTHDTVTLTLDPADGARLAFEPGQFTMLGMFGAGEAPISVSGDPAGPGPLQQTVRDGGGVTHALAYASPGDMVTVRGPYGHGWGVADGAGRDVLIVAGGIGLAPLRPAVLAILASRRSYRRVSLLYGARAPGERLFTGELATWGRYGVEVETTVDHAEPGWRGNVGLVTNLIPAATFDPSQTLALVCGPEVMMRFVATALTDAGIPAGAIRVSLERSMECGVGLCGHCQLRELFICTDGPVLGYERVAGLMPVREY